MRKLFVWAIAAAAVAAAGDTAAQSGNDATVERVFRLYEGITLFVDNAAGVEFAAGLDVRDINLLAGGARETLVKVYDPDGLPVVREVIADDGCVSANFPDRIGGWDHELQYYGNLYAKGTAPSFRWSAWSDPARLRSIAARTFTYMIGGGKKGVYRIVLAGTPDIYVTVRLPAALKVGYAGHPTFMHGHGGMMRKAYLYVPRGSSGVFFAFAEPDQPRGRHFKLTTPDGKVFFDGMASGGFAAVDSGGKTANGAFARAGQYDGQLLTLEVTEGANDFLAKVTFQQPRKIFGNYVGMGSSAVFCDDAATAMAIAGGTRVVDGETFWHPFQVRFHDWLKEHGATLDEALRKDVEYLYDGMRYLEVGDNRGSASWSNMAYAMGYYGCDIFRPGWVLMGRADVPAALKEIIREGLIMAGDRLGFATHIEKVNGNAFAQMNVALWYCQRATGDALQKERFETFWQRWVSEGWGPGSGLSRSGDAQEHFAHDAHYGSYLLDNWRASGTTWIKGGVGILGDARDDPRFQQVYDRYRNLYSYLFCREANGQMVAANPWSSRTFMAPHRGAENWEYGDCRWKGEPGPDFTVNVNDGGEWFAARRKGYYMLTFHGRLAPEWLSRCFEGELGFSGGTICQLTVPGKGPVIAGTLLGSYGEKMDPSQWAGFRIHSLVGTMWDGTPLVAAVSEQDDAALNGITVSGSGEVRGAHVRASRSYKYNDDSIECSVALHESDYARVLSVWSHGRNWSQVREAWELLPIMPLRPDGKTATAVTAGGGGELTEQGVETAVVRVDRGGFGVELRFGEPRFVRCSPTGGIMIRLAVSGGAAEQPVAAEKVTLTYKLVPFG